jgi:hypothetical protein
MEDKLKQQNIQEIKAQIIAHKAAMDKVQEEMERSNQEELEALRHQCESDMGEQN